MVGDTSKPLDCQSGANALTILDTSGNRITYALINSQITKSVNGGVASALTSPDISISNLTFRVFGSYPSTDPSGGTTDLLQPEVIVTIFGSVAGIHNTGSTFSLETTISQRKLDFQ